MKSLRYKLVESLIRSKEGDPSLSEDLIHLNDHFVAVIDGATSKTQKTWAGETVGKNASTIINEVLSDLDPQAGARQAVDEMTARIRDFYESFKSVDYFADHPNQRFTATLAAVSLVRKEIWLIGDCQVLVNGTLLQNHKKMDGLMGEARAVFLDMQLLLGHSLESLQTYDKGRQVIVPFLERQGIFQNNPVAGDYWYPVIDGFPVPDEGIIVKKIPPGAKHIVLATDGYPRLFNSLKKSEDYLHRLLEDDPLLMREFKSTKGKLIEHESFDDRAYVKIALGG